MNQRKNRSLRTVVLPVLLALAMAAASPLGAQQTKRLGVLGLENLNRDPRYDYLEGMILGVLMYDFIRTDGVELVERARLDRVIDEQNLALMGLLSDSATARQVGQLAEADALLEGSYAFLGREVIVNLSVMTVADGKTTALTARGSTENVIHNLAEQVVEALTGTPVIFAGPDGERSLLSLSDEKPGSIEFYCNFIEGEVYVDEEFYGYTPGGTTPMLLEDLSPGEHTIRVEAGYDFGEIEWPAVVFKDWQRTVDVTAGRKSIVRATIYHFNTLLYDALNLFREHWRIESGGVESMDETHDLTYVDRTGRTVPVTLRVTAVLHGKDCTATCTLTADGEQRAWEFGDDVEEREIQETVGPVDVTFSKDWYSNRYWYIEAHVERRDIWQGLQRGEPRED